MADITTVAVPQDQATWLYYLPYLYGAPVWNSQNECLGRVARVLLDDAGNPEYVAVRSNHLRARSRLMPLAGAKFGGVRLVVSHPRRLVLTAPNYVESELTQDTRDLLRQHYQAAA